MRSSAAMILAVLLTTFVQPLAHAQKLETSATPINRLALAVVYNPDSPPTYQSIYSTGGVWYSAFKQSPSSSDRSPRAVYLVPQVKGGEVSVRVSLLSGEFLDKEEVIGTYRASQNSTEKLSALARFGIEPFEISLVNIDSILPAPPFLDNKTALIVESVDVVFKGVPNYRLIVRNATEKDVKAIHLHVLQNGRKQLGRLVQGEEGRPLIAPGEAYQADMLSVIRATPSAGGYSPEALPAQTVVLASAVFADGSYQGDSWPAAMVSAFDIGRKAAIGQLVPIFKETLTAADLDSTQAIERLKLSVADMNDSIDESELTKLARKYPGQDTSLKSSAQVALHLLRKSFLTDLEKFAAAQNGSAQKNAFREWLEGADRTYRAWFSRL